jgi:hypothetical protein
VILGKLKSSVDTIVAFSWGNYLGCFCLILLRLQNKERGNYDISLELKNPRIFLMWILLMSRDKDK